MEQLLYVYGLAGSTALNCSGNHSYGLQIILDIGCHRLTTAKPMDESLYQPAIRPLGLFEQRQFLAFAFSNGRVFL